MADLEHITAEGETYDISDATARTDISALQTENENLKAQIAEMEEKISQLNSDLIVTDTVSTTQTIGTNTTYTENISCSKSGYTAIGVAGFYTNSGYANVFRVCIGGNNVQVGIRNIDSSNSRDVTIEITVLYRKNA